MFFFFVFFFDTNLCILGDLEYLHEAWEGYWALLIPKLCTFSKVQE